MRVDIVPIIGQAVALADAIRIKSRSRAASAAHKLLGVFPDPTWAETAPGYTVLFCFPETGQDERILTQKIEQLRYAALTWLRALIDPRTDWEPTAKWPEPENLIHATRELAALVALKGVDLEEHGPVPIEV